MIFKGLKVRENMDDISHIKSFCSDKLKLNVDDSHINRGHILGKCNRSDPLIIVHFPRNSNITAILKKCLKFKGIQTEIIKKVRWI